MKASGRLRVQFEHRHPNNGAKFIVVFLADARPFQLIVVAKGAIPLVIVTDVLPGFRVSPWIESGVALIATLKRILGVIPGGQTPFKLTSFFKEVASSAPTHVSAADDARPSVIARHHSDVEEADKIYFTNFRLHGQHSHVTKINLDKTRLLLGQECYRVCRDRNISSCWSADPEREKPWDLRKAEYKRDNDTRE
ncbi:hypothetical protein BKG56_01225 [Mycobacteroides chelonae]|nr:hypothetical protein GR01_03755 [Mycobacteroides chelonae]ANB00789.1 hypothetical protein BB28_03810 [Mycobacteroides chelonae CCUG 47445]OLT80940.1 hypothetical protein BKG56_01225 [Mycobacteroides chelonae]